MSEVAKLVEKWQGEAKQIDRAEYLNERSKALASVAASARIDCAAQLQVALRKGFKKAFDDAAERGETRCSICLSTAHSKEYHENVAQVSSLTEQNKKWVVNG